MSCMIGKKINRIFAVLMCAMMMVIVFPITANADIGPKASVRVQFENMGDTLCYGTLLSKTDSTGPQSAWDGNEEHIYNYNLDPDIWRAFVEYEDTDGYYFLQIGWKVSETKEIAWTYYPPSSFKILLYYPETDQYIVSGIYEKYAFDTYYTVDMDGIDIGSVDYNDELSSNERIDAYRSYNYRIEFLSLIARIVITIIIEMIVALFFGFRQKNQLLLLIGVNTVTQIILNILLNVINYQSGEWAFVFFYVLFEWIIFALEAVVYCLLMNKWTDKPKKRWFYIVYALVANTISFGSGMVVAHIFPGIF